METNLIQFSGLGLLAVLLALAVWRDVAGLRIPNAVVFPGTAAALLLSLLPGGIGITDALAGLGVGLAAMLPLYMLRAAGAGDAKLMAMAGAFVGWKAAIGVVLASWMAGLLLSLLVITQRRIGFVVARNFESMALGTFDPRQTAAKLPYSCAIAIGTAVFVGWRALA